MAKAATDLFDFINDLYSLLPDSDRNRFGELWTAYEQTLGDFWTKLLQSQLNCVINTLQNYNIQRWLLHSFDDSTQVSLAATYTTNQDLSQGINLTTRYLIRFSVDGGPQIEVNLTGINPARTTSVEIRDKINAAAGFAFAALVVDDALLQFTSPTKGPASDITFHPASIPGADASGIVLGLDQLDLPQSFPEFHYSYQLVDTNIVSIPKLQNKVRDESVTQTLLEGTDYAIQFGTGVISFKVVPPASMWAQNTLYNFETPYNNFGYLMNFYAPNTAGYLKAVKGLWFAYWTGPRPENIKRSLYLLFGLPTASKAGVVTSLSPTEIMLTYADNSTETFAIPANLFAIVSVGDTVEQFQPLTTGVSVLDKVNSPGFLEREVGRAGIQRFLTQFASKGLNPNTDESKALKTVEENTYLPQIDVNAFISADINLGNVRTFLTNLQPKSRTFLFQIIVGTFSDLLSMGEALAQQISFDVSSNVDYNPNTYAQQSDLDDAETNPDTGIKLDDGGWTLVDYVDMEVYWGATLVDTLHVEG